MRIIECKYGAITSSKKFFKKFSKKQGKSLIRFFECAYLLLDPQNGACFKGQLKKKSKKFENNDKKKRETSYHKVWAKIRRSNIKKQVFLYQ